MVRRLYYTPEILLSSILGAGIMLLFFTYDGVRHGVETGNLIGQLAVIFIFYFIIYFVAFFFLINLFADFLKRKYNIALSTIIILISANIILIFGLYVDTLYTAMEVVIANYRIFLATNIAIAFFNIRKRLANKVSK